MLFLHWGIVPEASDFEVKVDSSGLSGLITY